MLRTLLLIGMGKDFAAQLNIYLLVTKFSHNIGS